MKTIGLILSFLTLTLSPTAAGEFVQLPNGQTVFTPQPRDFPTPQYYRPEGGPPIGYGVRSGNQTIFIPYNNQPPQTESGDE